MMSVVEIPYKFYISMLSLEIQYFFSVDMAPVVLCCVLFPLLSGPKCKQIRFSSISKTILKLTVVMDSLIK